MATRTTRKKTTAKTTGIAKRTQPHGGALNVGGTPGNAGGTGRPTKAFKKFCRELAASEEYQEALRQAATTWASKNFVGAAKLVASFATSKPAKKVHHLHTTSARARLADRLARIIERN
jgi:hypothetical protein